MGNLTSFVSSMGLSSTRALIADTRTELRGLDLALSNIFERSYMAAQQQVANVHEPTVVVGMPSFNFLESWLNLAARHSYVTEAWAAVSDGILVPVRFSGHTVHVARPATELVASSFGQFVFVMAIAGLGTLGLLGWGGMGLGELLKHLSRVSKLYQSRYHLYHAPGFTLLRMAEFAYSKKVFEEVLQPTVSDFQAEYIEALAINRKWKARWVLLRGYWSFFHATGAVTVVGSFQKIMKIIRLVS